MQALGVKRLLLCLRQGLVNGSKGGNLAQAGTFVAKGPALGRLLFNRDWASFKGRPPTVQGKSITAALA